MGHIVLPNTMLEYKQCLVLRIVHMMLLGCWLCDR